MSPTKSAKWKYEPIAYLLVIIAWLAYATLTFNAPESANAAYHLAKTPLALFRLTIIIPIHLIWLVAVYGASTLKHYTNLIANAPEKPGLNAIANGLLWVLSALITSPLISSIIPFFANQPLADPLIIIRDHLTVILSFIGFAHIYYGSHQLKNINKLTTWNTVTALSFVPYGIFSALFARQFHLTAATPTITAARTSATILSETILIFTLVFPYLASWFLGLIAVVNIIKYARTAPGIIYRQSLRHLARGTCLVVFFSITSQIIVLSARFLIDIQLLNLLAIIYTILCLYGAGFLVIAYGAKKLRQIEEAQ